MWLCFSFVQKIEKKSRNPLGIWFDLGLILLIQYVKMFCEVYLRKGYEREIY